MGRNFPVESIGCVEYFAWGLALERSRGMRRASSKRTGLLVFALIAIILAGCVAPERIAPRLEERPIRVAVLGDNRGTAPLVQPAVFKRIVREINREKVDMTFIVGDLIFGCTDDAGLVEKEWDEFDRVAKHLKSPLILAIGNHDVWDAASEGIWLRRYGKRYFSFTKGPVQFIVLDCEIPGEAGKITGVQLEWFKRKLAKGSNFPYRFIFLHRPLWADKEWQANVHPILKQFPGVYVFAGHIHAFGKTELDGVHHILTGGAGAPLGGSYDEGNFYHYLIVEASRDGVKIDLREVPPFQDPPPEESPASAILSGPYVQNVSPRSATIMVRFAKPSFISVRYKKKGFGFRRVAYGLIEDEPFSQQEVRLESLKPDSVYEYEVSFRQSHREPWKKIAKGSLCTAPVKARPFIFAVYGDSRSLPETHSRVARAIAEARPEFVLHTGDLVASGGVLEQWRSQFFSGASAYMDEVTLWPSLGNHEGGAVWYFTFMALPGNERWYSFDYANAHFIILDSNVRMDPESRQYAWLKEDLSKTHVPWKFIGFHHPAFSSGPHGIPGEDGRPREKPMRDAEDYILPLAGENDVAILFWGHDHIYERSIKDGVQCVTTGGGGAPLYEITASRNPYSVVAKSTNNYCLVEINGNELRFRALDLERSEIDSFQLIKMNH